MGYGPIINGKQHPITPYKGSWAEDMANRRLGPNGGVPYNEQLEIARRWDRAVDAGSPITARSSHELP